MIRVDVYFQDDGSVMEVLLQDLPREGETFIMAGSTWNVLEVQHFAHPCLVQMGLKDGPRTRLVVSDERPMAPPIGPEV